jgi:hypothetical protein
VSKVLIIESCNSCPYRLIGPGSGQSICKITKHFVLTTDSCPIDTNCPLANSDILAKTHSNPIVIKD